DVVLGRAAKVFRAEYEFPFLHHATMEPMNCTARAHADGRIELWAPTQFPNWSAQAVAGALKLQPAQVTVHVTLIGGGFGRRINPDYSVEAALIAKQLDRPVQVVWTREDDMTHGMYRPIARHVLEASLDANGWPEAWRHRMATTAINGNPGPGTRPFGGGESDGVGNMGYRVPNRTTEYTPIASRAPRGWWRAVHTTHGTFALETFLDELAEAAGKDPLEYRLALLDQVPVTNPQPSRDTPFDPERMKGVLRLAAEKAGWGKPLPAGHAMGIACVQDHRTHAAEVVHASIEGGRLRIHEVVVAADCAFVVNPSGARAQMEGGVMQGLSAALHERVTLSGGAVAEKNFDRYRLLRISEAPVKVSAYFVEHPENTVRITGLGEPAVPIVAPALANAIYRITKKRIRTLPMGTAFA
ncbi:MAG TPA: molybdopterin cofactor-binding domain-containing protein, partial [Gemmatimonadales bacterium]|nr:molybdopterin cofactor-binding domain-containing protein [Gemmatimonadales bacterium]